ncbi:hypothetical protein Nepgr_005346 [Nepenthes gracilis]|uniref:Uncharacterized protein n=1 Tax=Nepenthes gracilis TaxID=150966 RepID=A0AAD3XGC2_NEPGR|nr:hypothetical protein Nepgr_005346 [Nepenthes gracilis]
MSMTVRRSSTPYPHTKKCRSCIPSSPANDSPPQGSQICSLQMNPSAIMGSQAMDSMDSNLPEGEFPSLQAARKVSFKWKLKHHGNGRPAIQKNTSKSTAAKQAVVNLNPDVVSVTFAEPEASIAIEKVPMDSISISPEEKVDILVNSTSASGMSGRSKDYSLDSMLNLSPQEGARTAPGNISSCDVGPISLPLKADADPPTDPDTVGSVADSLDADGLPLVDSVVQSSDVTPFKALDQAPFLKRVRFAPEILSAEASSSAPHRKLLAPCSDIYHPIKFRGPNLGNLASEDVPVDDDPNLGANIEYHDLLIPPSDGVTQEMEPASVIDPDLTPSPVPRISKKYSLFASNFEEPFSSSSVASTERAKKKTQKVLASSNICCEGLNSDAIGCHLDSTGFIPVELLHVQDGYLGAKESGAEVLPGNRLCVSRSFTKSGTRPLQQPQENHQSSKRDQQHMLEWSVVAVPNPAARSGLSMEHVDDPKGITWSSVVTKNSLGVCLGFKVCSGGAEADAETSTDAAHCVAVNVPIILLRAAVAEGSVLDVFDSVNSFAILQDHEDLDVQELQCGPLVELSCNAPVFDSGTTSDSKAAILVNLEPDDDVHPVPLLMMLMKIGSLAVTLMMILL